MPRIPFTTEKEHKGYLRVNSCGKQWLIDKNYVTERKEGRIDYSILYVLNGKGYCEIDNTEIEISEGNLILYFPNEQQNYGFIKDDNSVILWSHFSGTACETLKECISNTPTVITVSDRKQFESAFSKMIAAFYKKNEYSEMLCSGYMAVLISLVAQSSVSAVKNNLKFSNEKLDKVLAEMLINYNQPINIKEYAKVCSVGEDHFIRIFKAYTGLPPYNYQLQLRMSHAIELLENTPMTISECAEEVGFSDAAYFSKVFKRFTGKPPSYYKGGKNR